ENIRLVDVLSPESYAEYHLPGAINIPLTDDFENQVNARLQDKDEKIVVYCMDEDCPASDKAAQRLEAMGYQCVLDYAAGKSDWKNHGLPVEHWYRLMTRSRNFSKRFLDTNVVVGALRQISETHHSNWISALVVDD